MKNLKKFDTHVEYETYIASDGAIKPNVSICADNTDKNHVHYNPYVEPIIEVTVEIDYQDMGFGSPVAPPTTMTGIVGKTLAECGFILPSVPGYTNVFDPSNSIVEETIPGYMYVTAYYMRY